MVSTEEIKEKAKIIEQQHNLNYYELLQRYMFERILERISVSKYQDNFILKGGLLLSAMFGIDNRTTKDMDTTITGIDIAQDKLIKVLNEILSINLRDGVKFDIVDINDIRIDDEYGGNKYYIVGRKENLKVNLEIDISTGDQITANKLKYKYPLLFENRTILISSFNLETILSEKIETILKRGTFNSRMKDFYDVYYLLTTLRNEIDIETIKKAINNTFIKRNSINYLKDYKEIINAIRNTDKIKNLWQSYIKKHPYAKNINILEILELLEKFIKKLNLEEVYI